MDHRKKTLTSRRASGGFTLIELIIVVGIMALLFALSGDMFSGTLRSRVLPTVARQLAADLDGAVLLAQKENRPIEVRFLRFHPEDLPGGGDSEGGAEPPQLRAYQFAVLTGFDAANRPEYRLLSEVKRFPTGIALMPVAEYTTLMSLPTREPGPNDPAFGPQYTIVSFQIRPDGTTSLPRNPPPVLTLVEDTRISDPTLPLNYRSITIDPDNGQVRSY